MNRDEMEHVKDVRNSENSADASITARVKMVLMFHRSNSISNPKVDTNEGTVTLGGMARNGVEKDLAAKLITYINGVKSVVNNLVIDESMFKNDNSPQHWVLLGMSPAGPPAPSGSEPSIRDTDSSAAAVVDSPTNNS